MLIRVILSAVLLGLVINANVYAQTTTLNATVTEGRALLQQQRAQEAFAVFKAQENIFAGDTNFDYWLGVAAVRAGELFEASVALERVNCD